MRIHIQEIPLYLICIFFLAASAIVWFSGIRLSRYTNAIAKKTGTADVIMGTLLLGGVTSLPEVVTTITASSLGNAGIAINNLFGGVALQVTILAVGDIIVSKQSITSLIESPVVQLQGVIGVLLLAVSAGIIVIGDAGIAHVGFGSMLVLLIFVVGFYLVNYFQSIHWWKSNPDSRDSISMAKENIKSIIDAEETAQEKAEEKEMEQSFSGMSKKRLFFNLVLSGVAVIIGGYLVVESGQAIASRTGLGSNLVGAIMIAFATSLPELSTTISSIKLQEYRLAFSNIFGTNIFTIGFIFLADLFYKKGPVLNEVSNFSLFGSVLGIVLTTVYLIGLSMRFKKTFLNMGYDSVIVLLGYLAGMWTMFRMS